MTIPVYQLALVALSPRVCFSLVAVQLQVSVAVMGSQMSQENLNDDCETVVEAEQVGSGRKIEG